MFHSFSTHFGAKSPQISMTLLAAVALLLAVQPSANAQAYEAPFPISAQKVSLSAQNPNGATASTVGAAGNSFSMDLSLPHGFAQFPQPRGTRRAALNPKMRLRVALRAAQPATATDPAAETMYSIDEHGIHVRSVQAPNIDAAADQNVAANPARQLRNLTAVTPFFGFQGRLPSRNDMRFLTAGD